MNKNGKPPDCGFPFLYSIYWIFFIVAFVLFCVVPSVASGVVFSSAGRCVSGSFVFSSVAGSVSSCVLLSPESSVFFELSVLSCFCVRCVVVLLFVDACVFFVVCSAVCCAVVRSVCSCVSDCAVCVCEDGCACVLTVVVSVCFAVVDIL